MATNALNTTGPPPDFYIPGSARSSTLEWTLIALAVCLALLLWCHHHKKRQERSCSAQGGLVATGPTSHSDELQPEEEIVCTESKESFRDHPLWWAPVACLATVSTLGPSRGWYCSLLASLLLRLQNLSVTRQEDREQVSSRTKGKWHQFLLCTNNFTLPA